MKSIIMPLAAGIVAMTATAALAAERWDMPMAYADSNFHTQLGKQFAARVNQATNGQLEIVVHGGGSLFKGGEIKRAVQTGQAPIGERLISALSNENPIFGIDAVPFLATDYQAARDLYEASRPAIEKILDGQGLKLLYAVPWPPQGIYANKALNSVADMKGLKFRAYNPATARLAELTGAVPTQIEAAELSQALATGVANSFISSGATGVDRKVWEHLSHFYDTQAWLPKNMVIVNKAAWDGLDAKIRTSILNIASEVEWEGWDQSAALAAGYLKTLAANGMTVTAPSPEFKAELAKIGETMTKEWIDQAGDDGAAIIAKFKGN